jgi:hypothetical protein
MAYPKKTTTVKSSGMDLLDRAAWEVVLGQRYAPAIRDCAPVSGTYLYEIDFKSKLCTTVAMRPSHGALGQA